MSKAQIKEAIEIVDEWIENSMLDAGIANDVARRINRNPKIKKQAYASEKFHRERVSVYLVIKNALLAKS